MGFSGWRILFVVKASRMQETCHSRSPLFTVSPQIVSPWRHSCCSSSLPRRHVTPSQASTVQPAGNSSRRKYETSTSSYSHPNSSAVASSHFWLPPQPSPFQRSAVGKSAMGTLPGSTAKCCDRRIRTFCEQMVGACKRVNEFKTLSHIDGIQTGFGCSTHPCILSQQLCHCLTRTAAQRFLRGPRALKLHSSALGVTSGCSFRLGQRASTKLQELKASPIAGTWWLACQWSLCLWTRLKNL